VRKIIPLVAAGATTLALVGGTAGYAALDKDVTLAVDGVDSEVSTLSDTVGEVLADEGIAVGPHDVVAPGVDADVTDGTRIAVQFGRQVRMTIDGKERTFWTTATRVGDALASFGIPSSAELSTSRSASIGRAGLDLKVGTEKDVVIKTGDKKRKVTTTATTVGEALTDAKVKVDSNDKVSRAKGAVLRDGSTIKVTKVDVRTVRREQTIGYDTVRKSTSRLSRGTTRVQTAGSTGVRTVVYKQTLFNGDVEKSKKLRSRVTEKPRTQVLLVGTARPSGGSSGSGGSSAPSVASGGVWDRLAQCEAGGNWSINTGNGFYGGLQFTLSTWRAYGGSGMPHQASREQQIAVGKRVQAGQGWGAWPACTSKLGIR
jgi:uncharacterized protein YabE (DUF348 family)